MTSSRDVCPPCRTVDSPACRDHETISVSSKWRAPRRADDRAWKRIAAGDVLWDHHAVERAATSLAERRARRRRQQTLMRAQNRRRGWRIGDVVHRGGDADDAGTITAVTYGTPVRVLVAWGADGRTSEHDSTDRAIVLVPPAVPTTTDQHRAKEHP